MVLFRWRPRARASAHPSSKFKRENGITEVSWESFLDMVALTVAHFGKGRANEIFTAGMISAERPKLGISLRLLNRKI